MKVQGDYHFDAPREEVWQALLDPQVLAATMPGCEKLELTGENTYQGALDIKVGPVQGKFQGKVELSDLAPGEGYTMKVDGRGAPGFVNANAGIRLADDDGGTRLHYDGDAQVGGRIASVGQRLLESSAKSIIRQSLEGLDRTLRARSSTPAEGATPGAAPADTPPPPRAPSQAQIATRVARDVATDLVPKPVLVGGIVAVVLFLLWLIFG